MPRHIAAYSRAVTSERANRVGAVNMRSPSQAHCNMCHRALGRKTDRNLSPLQHLIPLQPSIL